LIMPRHIGIVACSAEGAALCYKTICVERADLFGPFGHPEVSLHTHSLARYVQRLDRNDFQGIGDLMLSSTRKLAAAGADVLICPDNTIHQAFAYVRPRSPLPWLHIAEVVADEATKKGYRRLGLLGTRWLVDSEVYPEKLAAAWTASVRTLSSAKKPSASSCLSWYLVARVAQNWG
jgi:aspartate racemase